jgi:hypothetical protein
MNSYQMVLHRPVKTAIHFGKFTGQPVRQIELGETPFARTSLSHFTLSFRQLTLRLRVDLQTPRKIVTKG